LFSAGRIVQGHSLKRKRCFTNKRCHLGNARVNQPHSGCRWKDGRRI